MGYVQIDSFTKEGSSDGECPDRLIHSLKRGQVMGYVQTD